MGALSRRALTLLSLALPRATPVAVVLIASAYGTAAVGRLSLLVSLLTLGAAVCDWGGQQRMTTHGIGNRSAFGSLVCLRLRYGVPASLAVCTLVAVSARQSLSLILAIGATLVALSAQGAHYGAFGSRRSPGLSALLAVIEYGPILLAIVLTSGQSLYAPLLGRALGASAAALLFLAALRQPGPRADVFPARAYGAYAAGIGLAGAVASYSDAAILASVASLDAVGTYRLVQTLVTPLSLVGLVVLPILQRRAVDSAKPLTLSKDSRRLALLAGGYVLLVLIVHRPLLTAMGVLGDVGAATPALILLGSAGIIGFATLPLNAAILTTMGTKPLAQVAVATSIAIPAVSLLAVMLAKDAIWLVASGPCLGFALGYLLQHRLLFKGNA